MSDLENYPEEHPETGKVKNPITGNFVKKSYAKKKDLLEQAKEHTQQHFMEQDDDAPEESEEIDELLKAAEEADPGEGFDLSEEELERLDERADINHPEVPDSEFPDEEGFDPDQEFEQPPTPEGLDDAAQTQKDSGDHQAIYSTGNASRRRPRSSSSSSGEKSMEQKHEDEEVRYVRTDAGGMKMVYPNENNDQ